MIDKPVQIRPWRLTDKTFTTDINANIDLRNIVIIDGIPYSTEARELGERLQRLFGPVSYVGIDMAEDENLEGVALVIFATTQAFIAAISGRCIDLFDEGTLKRARIGPYVMNEQMCDHCEGKQNDSRYAPYFCGGINCLQYYCEFCWDHIHYRFGSRRVDHRPFVRTGDQIRVLPRAPLHSELPLESVRPSRRI